MDDNMLEAALRSVNPRDLAKARTAAHRAVQLPARAAIANLAAKEDWSHSSLAWSDASGALVTELLPGGLQIAVTLSPLTLEAWRPGGRTMSLALSELDDAEALSWLDEVLATQGARPASSTPPSSGLPPEVDGLHRYPRDIEPALQSLSAWYALSATALQRLASELQTLQPGPTPVRCWPHHFDIATLVRLSDSDDEDAPSIGCGMAPGDGAYDEPYFYVNPWPHLDSSTPKPALPLGHWHLDGFVGAVATGTEILARPGPETALDAFLKAAFDLGRAEMPR